MKTRRGISLPELLLVVALFSLFLVIAYQVMRFGVVVGLRTESGEDVGFQLRKAYISLERDVRVASHLQMSFEKSADLSVFWFLSAVDEESGRLVLKSDGKPFWQRNIIYYTAVAKDHDGYHGVRCSQASYCPHKVLIRRVVDAGPPTGPDSAESEIEELLPSSLVQDWAESPESLGKLGFVNSAEQERVIATGLLDFEMALEPEGWGKEVACSLTGFSNKEAGKAFAIGRQSLDGSPFTHRIKGSFFPGN